MAISSKLAGTDGSYKSVRQEYEKTGLLEAFPVPICAGSGMAKGRNMAVDAQRNRRSIGGGTREETNMNNIPSFKRMSCGSRKRVMNSNGNQMNEGEKYD